MQALRRPIRQSNDHRPHIEAMSDDSQNRMLRRALAVFAVPWVMVIAIVLGYVLGAYLDARMDLGFPVATIVLLVIAVAGGGYQSYRIILRILRD